MYNGDRRYKRGTTGLKMGLGALLFVGSCAGISTGVSSCEYSKGERDGVINKFSENGVAWKTYEGEMALEGMVSSGQYVGANIWRFSIDDSAQQGKIDSLAEQVKAAMESGNKVKIVYTQSLLGLPWRGGTDYYIQSIEPIKPKESK